MIKDILFFDGLEMTPALKRQNKVVGIGQRFEYILGDDRLRLDVSA
jgi:hypothetical protein